MGPPPPPPVGGPSEGKIAAGPVPPPSIRAQIPTKAARGLRERGGSVRSQGREAGDGERGARELGRRARGAEAPGFSQLRPAPPPRAPLRLGTGRRGRLIHKGRSFKGRRAPSPLPRKRPIEGGTTCLPNWAQLGLDVGAAPRPWVPYKTRSHRRSDPDRAPSGPQVPREAARSYRDGNAGARAWFQLGMRPSAPCAPPHPFRH